ncbi:hypothetical protein AAVH_25742 [Aphelenchoides avenae]|nr:hypothetical protein AAVH_25742 [Aphelenchus avenae]
MKRAGDVHDGGNLEQLEQLHLQEVDADVDYDTDASLELGFMPQLQSLEPQAVLSRLLVT